MTEVLIARGTFVRQPVDGRDENEEPPILLLDRYARISLEAANRPQRARHLEQSSNHKNYEASPGNVSRPRRDPSETVER
jgi:hypothetical protein